MPVPGTDYRDVAAEVSEGAVVLRRSLRAVLDRLLPDGYGARSLGRALELEQTTAWRCWHIAHIADPAKALQAMPGRRAWEGVFRALERHGATRAELDALRAAFARIEPMVFGRRADRPILRSLAAGGLDTASQLSALRDLRRATARGNARLYGVAARTMILGWFVAPGPAKGTVSLGVAGVLDGLRRLRPGPPWPVMQRSIVSDAGGRERELYTPLGDDPELRSLIRRHSTPDAAGAGLRLGVRHSFETIELADVAADRNGRLRLAHAEFTANAGSLPSGQPLPAALATPILVPLDLLVFELHVHRDVGRHTEPSASLYGTHVTIERISSIRDAIRMPLEESMRSVATDALPARLKSLDPARGEAFRRVVAAQGAIAGSYDVHRLVLPYPPLFTTVCAEFELAGSVDPG